jgi:hypothetical protein
MRSRMWLVPWLAHRSALEFAVADGRRRECKPRAMVAHRTGIREFGLNKRSSTLSVLPQHLFSMLLHLSLSGSDFRPGFACFHLCSLICPEGLI